MPPSKRPADAKGMKSLSFFFDKKPTSKSSTTIAATATAKNQAKAVVMATPKPTSFSKKQEENPKTPETEASSLGEDSDVEIQTTSPVVASSKKKTTSSTISASKSKARASMVQKKRKVIIDSDEEDDEEEEKKCEDPAPNTSAAAKEPPRKKAAVPNGKATLPKQTTKEMSNTKPAALSKITIKKPASTPVPAKTTNHTKTANNKTNKAASAASAWGALLNGSFKTPDKKKSNNKRKKSTNSEEDEGAGTAQMRSILKAPYSDGDDLPILSEPQEFFDDMIQNQLCNNGTRPNILLPLLETLASRGPLKIATMCSGTESPVLALDMIVNSIESFCQTQGIRMENGNGDGSVNIRLKHVFSCEIEPAKQAYIERNFQPPLLFRDIRELGDDQARTAYGALVDVPNTPGCVDILVAGTSCVDYSNLNTKKKQMEAGGESGQTFQGMLKWIDKAQPSIVILENVVGAPWEKKIEIMESYGYAATWMRVDSKKYYIPHTRQRGYLFAVRQDPKKKMVDQKRLKGWEATMKKLERPASAPLDALMLPNDDPRVLRGRARLTQESSSGGDAGDSRAGRTDWSKCEARHVRARVDEELGDKRLLTGWADTGKTMMPYWAWNDWTNAQVHRVHDLMDINTLRLAGYDCDQTYKTMVWNLSQNVDRDTMGKLGLTMCLTPNGIFYVTSRGGPLVGEELLLLQGIPSDDLLLTKESEDILKDLAGNAMSTTVVGACILGALLHGHEALRTQPEIMEESADDSMMSSLVPRPLVPVSQTKITQQFGMYSRRTLNLGHPTSTDTKVIPKLLSDSWLSSRKCISEGPDEATSFDSIFECTECGQTAHKDLCTPPRKYEEHNFKPIQADASRLQPSSFRKELLSALPMQVAISGINIEDCEKPENVDSVLWNDWKTRISECLPSEGSDNEYRFAHLDRSHVWTAHYKSISGKARVELQISRSSAEWQLYVEAPPRKGALRDIFTRPVARLRVDVNEGSFLAGTWEFRNLSESFVTLAIEASGSCYPSWKSKLGLKKFEDEVQFEKLTVTLVEDSEDDSHLLSLKKTIEGTYLHLPKCGNACGSLHKKQVGANEENVYFFLESGRRTLPTDDVYVFAPTSHRTEYMEYREIYLELEKKAQYRPNFAKAPKDSNERTKKVKARILGQWVPLKDSSIQAVDSKKPVSYSTPSSVLSAPVTDDGWKFAPEIISCDVPLDDSDELLTKCVNVGVPQDINVRKSKHILRHLSFVTSRFALPETFQQQQQQQEEEEDEVWLTLDRSAVKKIDGEDPVCTKCAPKQPRIRWTLVRRGTKQQYCPIEDWKDAAAYEAALKSRPTPWNIRLSVIEQESDSKKLRIQIGCNAFSLCQRAFGRFPTDTAARKAMIQLSDSNCNCVYEWRVIPHLEKSFGDFPKLRFTSNKGDPYAEQPSNFKLQLRPEQRRSLSWMLKQERTNAPYFEEEIAESILPNLEWRAEGRVRRPVLARGGIIADEVGYGKTCITLALIDENQTPFSELQRDAPSGRIPTKATLIIVPGHLIGQWPEEVKKFLGNSKKVIVIKDMTSFNSMIIADVQEADIVLVNFTVLCSDKYFQRLARLSGKSKNSVPTGKTANRHFESVYKECLTALPNRVEQIKNDCSSVFDDVEADAANCRQAEQEEDVDFRLDGKKAVYKQTSDSKKVKKQEKQKKEAEVETNPDPWNLSKPAVKKDFTKMTCPPLEIFHFGRTVIDEFTYLLEKADRQRPLTLVRRGLSTRHRWLLSGTPNHSNFADVRSLAGLLGIHLGVDEPVPGTKMSKKDNAESTGLEAMANFAETQSFYWHERRHRKAQEFLDRFVRQNIAEIDEIPYQEHEELVQLSSAERAIYLELETVLRALEMNHSSAQLSKKKSQSDRESRIQAILNESKSAEEALVKCASSFNLSGEDTQSAARTCQDIIHFRMAQKKNLEQEMVDFIAAALRQRARIDSLQEGWSALTKAETGEMLDAVGPYLSDVERSESISHGADDEIHARVRELVALAQRNAEESPNKVDCVFAAVNDADDDDDDIADERPAKKKKGDSEEKKIDRLFNMKYQLRNHVHRIRSLGKELCGRVRSLRYIEQIRSFQNNGAVDATCPGCGTARLSSENAGILSCCGHIGCLSCLKKYAGDGNCVNERSCSARVDPAHIVPAANLGSDNDGVDEEGAKLSAIVRKIKEIIDGEDRIIIFVQFDDLKDKVIEALDRNEIKSVQVKGTVDKQVKALAPFVKPTPAKSDPRVLLLKMDSECSSGLNLTNLNHAIFVHPLLASSQQQYEAYETQAIGRIRRFGQLKHVHVWRFLVKSSIDTEIYRERTGRSLE